MLGNSEYVVKLARAERQIYYVGDGNGNTAYFKRFSRNGIRIRPFVETGNFVQFLILITHRWCYSINQSFYFQLPDYFIDILLQNLLGLHQNCRPQYFAIVCSCALMKLTVKRAVWLVSTQLQRRYRVHAGGMTVQRAVAIMRRPQSPLPRPYPTICCSVSLRVDISVRRHQHCASFDCQHLDAAAAVQAIEWLHRRNSLSEYIVAI